MKITPQQCRAARGLLGLSQTQLAELASVAMTTVSDYESEKRNPRVDSLTAINDALESAGIIFETGKFIGVKIKR